MSASVEAVTRKQHNLILVPDEVAQSDAEHYLQFKVQDSKLLSNAQSPRPELAGKRLRIPGEPAIYLINPEGYRQWIPNPYTYNRLFRDWNGIYDDADLYEIPDAGPLSHGASIIRADGTSPVYLVSNGVKRHIPSPPVMDKCNFRWPDGGDVVGPAVVDAIPTGNNWNVPLP